MVKNVGDPGSIPGLGRSSGVGNDNLLYPGKYGGQRSLAGYCPWGRKESDTTEQQSTHQNNMPYKVPKFSGFLSFR